MYTYSRQQVIEQDGMDGRKFWACVDSYVLDLTSFLQHHPAGAQKIIKRREKSVDISSNFLDHYAHTVRAFREACQQYEENLSLHQQGDEKRVVEVTVSLKFNDVVEGEVLIIGKVDSRGEVSRLNNI